ncbi:hypothetical protein ACQHIV_26345 [Kribbella sp. GL6]|uniref:hypothetical protein n=1 Tax=Kribbella sp. GL6 TaxID=3419765 RepID=UPI003CFD5E1E
MHLGGRDIGGTATYRVVATRPELVVGYTAIETTLPGLGFELLAGAWHIGVFAAAGIPELLLAGRETRFVAECADSMGSRG